MIEQVKPGKWVGFDFDKTLALDAGDELGEPVPAMVALAKAYIEAGVEVRILTARVWCPRDERWNKELANECGRMRIAIMDWAEKHLGKRVQVTCEKDPKMEILYDDRVRQVEANTGKLVA